MIPEDGTILRLALARAELTRRRLYLESQVQLARAEATTPERLRAAQEAVTQQTAVVRLLSREAA